MKKTNLLITVLLAALILASCGILPFTSDSDLDGTAWTLENYDGQALIQGTVMTAFFEDGEISGSASCNHYFGSYKIKGDEMLVEGLGWTEMACMDPEGIMLQEQAIMSLLSRTIRYQIVGVKLRLQTEGGTLLVFAPLLTQEN